MEPDYTIGFEKGDISPYAHIQNENIECEVEPDEVSLRSFKVKDGLENHIWNSDGKIDKRVRKALMDISDDFWEYCGIRWVRPVTVLLTGSICNYNWSEFSDVDMHVVADFSKVHARKDFVQEYFDEKKNSWNSEHERLRVYGFPVEIYVEDISARTESSGVYDLWKDEWVKKPKKGTVEPIKLNKYAIKEIASDMMTEIDDLCDAFAKESDMHKVGEIGEKAKGLLERIKDIRKVGLGKSEMGSGNIVYKVLRRTGYLDRLWELLTGVYDKVNSVGDDDRFSERVTEEF